jgi:RNA polymerase sigma factor (sigma-70 family)
VEVDLNSLRQGDSGSWNTVFDWLWPKALATAKSTLSPFFPSEVEDAAIEGLEELVEKVQDVETVEELRPLTGGITHNRAVSLLRERFAKKRGEGRTTSLDKPTDPCDDTAHPQEPVSPTPALDELDQKELATLLGEVLRELKPEYRCVLQGAFLLGLTQQQTAEKCKLAPGTIGVYVQRAREAFRKILGRHPKLLKELEAYLR